MHHLAEDGRLPAVREMRRVLRPGGTLLLAEFAIPERGFWRAVASLTGHARGIERKVPRLEPLISAAGFEALRSGEAPPWLHYVAATKPAPVERDARSGRSSIAGEPSRSNPPDSTAPPGGVTHAVEARIETERASRYLTRLCRHAASMGRTGGHGPGVHLGGPMARGEVQVRAECSESQGAITFSPWGRCRIVAGADALTLRVEGTDDENLRRIQDIVTRDLDRFSGSDQLVVDWRLPEAADASPDGRRSS